MTTARTTATPAFDALRVAAASWGRLQPLSPPDYAVGHALFEARSDQRERVTRWLESNVEPTARRVLSIGTGDGSVDVRVARRLARGGGGVVDYVGVEPHAPSGAAFLQRLQAVSGVEASLAAVPFADFPADPDGYDVVLAVHSLYYVEDLGAALTRARALLAPDGRLIVLHAPPEALNLLVGVLAPGHPQEFSDAVELALQDVPHTRSRIEATLDLREGSGTDPGDERSPAGREFDRVVDFTVQAVVPPELRPLVVEALREASPEGDLVLPHPVDAFVVPGLQ